ncbi:MAG: hypothetical protein HC912_07010 [Saprospiraceae bacterium]|nr:hypothetical protein [Saprospiraceae bacterium]
MELIYNDIFLKHETGNHPENKKRLDAFRHLNNVAYPDAREWLRLVHTGTVHPTGRKSLCG